MSKSEAQTRSEHIDQLLATSGWNVKDPTQVVEEFDILTGLPESVAEPRTPYEGHQFSDYVLLGKDRRAIAVVEAKRTSKDAALGREQAKQYCYNIQKQIGGELPFCFYTNGLETYFWDLGNTPPRKVAGFPTRDDLERLWRTLKAGPKAATEAIHRYKVVTFHPSFTYEDFVRGIRPVRTAEDGTTQFRLVDGKFKQICDEAHANPGKRYALFIDEINRANIAKVFGELITLIEPDKRAVFDAQGRLVEGLAVHLPGEEEADSAERPFGVPKNLDIYGTMNTADRSIALLDVALRRRFQFEERGPDYETLSTVVEGVQLGQLLQRINDRLEYLLDRDHRIGHAYLMKAQTLDGVREAFAKQLIPLLQEYFFDDFSRVALVLSTTGDQAFVKEEPLSFGRLFARQQLDGVPGDRSRFIVTSPASWTASSFRGIYEDAPGVSPTT